MTKPIRRGAEKVCAFSHRDRVITALRHEEPDRVPRDLGGSGVTTVNATAYAKLAKYLGLEKEIGQVQVNRRSQTADPSEAVLRRFDVDCRALALGSPDVVQEEELGEHSYRDEWGVLWARPEVGHFINREGPFQRGEPTLADLEKHRWPVPRDPGRIKGLKERAIRLRRETDCAIVLSLGNSVVSLSQRLRGFAEWMEDLLLNPALADGLMEHTLTVTAGTAEYVLEEVGEYVDVVLFFDDLGFQDRPFFRPELYRKMVKPYHRRLVDTIKSKTKAKVLMHSDGSVYPLIGDLIEIGVDALNPVQVSAKNMDSARLKTEFGADLSFWGAIDTQRVLSVGSPEDVRKEVKRRIHDLAPGGGYVLASVHNIQAEVPPENIVAMFDSSLEYGCYD